MKTSTFFEHCEQLTKKGTFLKHHAVFWIWEQFLKQEHFLKYEHIMKERTFFAIPDYILKHEHLNINCE